MRQTIHLKRVQILRMPKHVNEQDYQNNKNRMKYINVHFYCHRLNQLIASLKMELAKFLSLWKTIFEKNKPSSFNYRSTICNVQFVNTPLQLLTASVIKCYIISMVVILCRRKLQFLAAKFDFFVVLQTNAKHKMFLTLKDIFYKDVLAMFIWYKEKVKLRTKSKKKQSEVIC